MDSFWWYVTLSAERELDDVLFSLADNTESIGTEFDELASGRVTLRAYYRSNEPLEYWKNKLLDAMKEFPEIKIEDFGKLENQPWNVQAEEAFPPLNVGENIVVLAPWHKGTEEAGRMPLYINPGCAFGTGYHESTQIVLRFMEEYAKLGITTADIGTGSGILTIYAVKKGAAKAYARDIDPAVIDEVRKNFELNGLDLNKIDLATGDLLKGFDHTADLLLANILIEPLSTMICDVPAVIGKKGTAVFSGMVENERERFLKILDENGLVPVAEKREGDWWGVAAKIKA